LSSLTPDFHFTSKYDVKRLLILNDCKYIRFSLTMNNEKYNKSFTIGSSRDV
jgi:hypothetical protein